MGSTGYATDSKRCLLLLLPGAFSRCHDHDYDTPQDLVLHLQRGLSLSHDVTANTACVLPATRLRGKDCTGSRCPAGLFCLHACHLRKIARNFGIDSSPRSVIFSTPTPDNMSPAAVVVEGQRTQCFPSFSVSLSQASI